MRRQNFNADADHDSLPVMVPRNDKAAVPTSPERVRPLAFLSPDLVETFLDGRQPVELTATRLTEIDLPLDWSEQQRLLAS